MKGTRFLIVDDDTEDQELFIDAVKEVDPTIECVSVYNGEEALDFLKKDPSVLPDYIFMDLNMPVLNGIQCLAEIKKTQTLHHIPVCIYTTSNWSKNEEETRKLGANHFFTKPVRFNEICKYISTILNSFPVSRS
ncbi:response regulator receiver domain-containing protein [Anseongella ginsenosidimutans]|uniref:Response regulator receiver domain-containing protein n=1 Tax=Anseongella ginsenosidimutans TaxID=496056 RepID=A0A4R3KU11_9SPHI|nr:response regulator [Anseongella ginsenosidimutans]QEC52904.1 response regulator [Anseongella ginsenosidimutans]TCS87295.1 response regulator receiver domain-containing protein [Anseongella ginsenosidimutans]